MSLTEDRSSRRCTGNVPDEQCDLSSSQPQRKHCKIQAADPTFSIWSEVERGHLAGGLPVRDRGLLRARRRPCSVRPTRREDQLPRRVVRVRLRHRCCRSPGHLQGQGRRGRGLPVGGVRAPATPPGRFRTTPRASGDDELAAAPRRWAGDAAGASGKIRATNSLAPCRTGSRSWPGLSV
jgi:hypothetical protein